MKDQLVRDCQRVINPGAQVSHGAFEFRMTWQVLHCAKLQSRILTNRKLPSLD
jgi:hypothetical protein